MNAKQLKQIAEDAMETNDLKVVHVCVEDGTAFPDKNDCANYSRGKEGGYESFGEVPTEELPSDTVELQEQLKGLLSDLASKDQELTIANEKIAEQQALLEACQDSNELLEIEKMSIVSTGEKVYDELQTKLNAEISELATKLNAAENELITLKKTTK